MKQIQFKKPYVPFVPLALEEQGIEPYEVKNNGIVMVPQNTSNRKLKICRRRAWAFYMSRLTGVRHLTREDVEKNISGVIPESEKRYFA